MLVYIVRNIQQRREWQTCQKPQQTTQEGLDGSRWWVRRALASHRDMSRERPVLYDALPSVFYFFFSFLFLAISGSLVLFAVSFSSANKGHHR